MFLCLVSLQKKKSALIFLYGCHEDIDKTTRSQNYYTAYDFAKQYYLLHLFDYATLIHLLASAGNWIQLFRPDPK